MKGKKLLCKKIAAAMLAAMILSASGQVFASDCSESSSSESEVTGEFVTRGDVVKYRFSDKSYAKGLLELDGEKYYFTEDNELIKNEWLTIDGKQYYASEDGSFLTGQQTVDGTVRFFDENGSLQTSGWINVNEDWYYLGKDGTPLTGWQSVNGNWYYMAADGKMAASKWIQNNNKWYYLKSSGKMAVSEWIQWKDDWYHVDSSGKMQTGSLTLSGHKWYFDESGRLTVNNSHPIDVPVVLQAPALPNGCEITALTELLRFYGFGVSHTEMAKTYLPRAHFTYSNGVMYGPDPDEYFVGNPEDKTGWYCLEGPILTAANKYLSEQGSSLRAKKISGADIEELKEYVDQGIPVMVWETPFLNEFAYSSVRWTLADGTVYKPYAGTHGLVITSINLDKGILTFSDPAKGKTTQKLDFFLRLYRAMGRRAVIIQ